MSTGEEITDKEAESDEGVPAVVVEGPRPSTDTSEETQKQALGVLAGVQDADETPLPLEIAAIRGPNSPRRPSSTPPPSSPGVRARRGTVAGVVLAALASAAAGGPNFVTEVERRTDRPSKFIRRNAGNGDGGVAGSGGTGGFESEIPGPASSAGGSMDNQSGAGGSGGSPDEQGYFESEEEATDLCLPANFYRDVEGQYVTLDPEQFCDIKNFPGGVEQIIGKVFIGEDGKIRECSTTGLWAPNGAEKVAGKVTSQEDHPGQLVMHEGKMCLAILDENQEKEAITKGEGTEVKVLGEAEAIVKTDGKVLIRKTRTKNADGDEIDIIEVTAIKGVTTIYQAERPEGVITLRSDNPDRKKRTTGIPLDKKRVKQSTDDEESFGCYIADVGHGNNFLVDGNGAVLLAGALLAVIGGRQKKDKKRG